MARPRYRLTKETAGVRLDAWADDEEELLRHAAIGTLAHGLGRAPRGEAVHWHAIAPWPDDLRDRLTIVVSDALYRLYLRGEATVEVLSSPDRGYLGVVPLPPSRSLEAEVQTVAVRSLAVNRAGRLRATLMLVPAD